MTDAFDSLDKLEEKIARAVEVLKRVQADKKALEDELERTKAATEKRAEEWDSRERELVALRREREDVRLRVERLLSQIDALGKPEA